MTVYKREKYGGRSCLVENGFIKNLRTKDSQLKILVIDTNLSLDHVLGFVHDGHVVYYYIADVSAYPCLNDTIAGDGFAGVQKVEDFAEVLDFVDLVYITDNCFPWLSVYLRDKGKCVFGPSPELVKWENDRVYFYQKAKSLKIAVPDGEVVKGKKALLSWLQKHEDGKTRFFVKVNKYRGSIETFSVVSAKEADVILAQAGFGPYLDELEFLVQIECDGIEIGCDMFVCPNGFLRPYSYTIEEKGRGNVAKWVEASGFEDRFYSLVKHVIREDDYRGNLSIEAFWDGRELRVIDVCSRMPYPVSSLYPRFIANWSEIIYAVANNELCEVKVDWDERYMAELTLSTDDKITWRTIEFDGEYFSKKGGIGFRRAVYKSGKVWFVPGDGVVATANAKGKSIEQALQRALEFAENVKCISVSFDGQFVQSVLEKISALRKMGREFVF